jgi:tetratricopeptide (TPR) repeat protein
MPGPATELDQAVSLHRAGNLDAAELLYQKILAREPRNADALHLFGMSALQRRQFDAAVERLTRAVAIAPGHAGALFHLASAQQERGDNAAAVAVYDRVVALMPEFADAFNNRGNALRALKRREDALASFDRAIALKPDFLVAFYNRGNVLNDLGHYADALAAFDRALTLKPDFVEALHNRGAVLMELRRYDEALASFDRCLALRPDFVEAQASRAAILNSLRRHDEALAAADLALVARPDYSEALNARGNALRHLDQVEGAIAAYDRAIVLNPSYAEAHSNRGNALRDLGRFDEALASYDAAIAARPDFAEGHDNRGVVLEDMQRYDDALASYDRALALNPDYAEAHANKSVVKLRLGDFAAGWPLYEWRWQSRNFAMPREDYRQPLWQGEAFKPGQTILLHAEQGLGDTLQFCRYAPMVAARGAKVVLEVPRILARLIGTLPGGATIITHADPKPVTDFHCPLLSLPGIFGTLADTVPANTPYLAAEPDRIVTWRDRVPSGDFRIGIHWQGNPNGKVDRGRSAPLAEFAPLARIAGVRLVSLQKYHGLDQLDSLPLGMEVATLGDDFDAGPDAFLDSAAALMNLDLLVSTDTAIVHLAGALNRPVWVPLQKAAHWIWALDRGDSPWYPSMRLFRQSVPGQWRDVFERIASEITRLRRQ